VLKNKYRSEKTLTDKIPTLLVVDDDELQHRIIASALRDENYNLLSAYNGAGAMTILLKTRPDLILMDFNMPDFYGLEVLDRIRNYRHISGVPIIMITSERKKNVVIDCLAAGAIGFIVKPFTRELLLLKVKAALRTNFPDDTPQDEDSVDLEKPFEPE